MLIPAVLYKEEIERLFAEKIYTEDFFYYIGYPQYYPIPKIRLDQDQDTYQWAIIDNGKLIGYFEYRVNLYLNSVDQFGLMSFDKGNITLAKDVYKKLTELICKHHRVEWRAIQGNPAIRSYTRFCQKCNGTIHRFKDVTKGIDGDYKDEYIFEIIKEQKNET